MKTYRLIRRMAVLFFLVPALLAACGSFMSARAEGPSQTRLITSLKIKWTATDNDGIESRLKVTRDYDPYTAFSIQYQIDFSLAGREAHEPGSVRVLVPRQIFHKRSGTADGSVMAAGYGGVSFSVPSAPSASASWHWEEAENGQYAIVNDATIDAAAQVMFQCSVTGLEAPYLVDMRPSDPLKVTVEVTDRAGGKDVMTSNELTAVVDTTAMLENIPNTSIIGASLKGTVYATADSVPQAVKRRLPGGAETADGYIFVCWTTRPYYRATQYYSLDMDLWAGEAEGNGASIPGIALGTTGSAGRIYTQDSGEQAGQHYSRAVADYEFETEGYNDGKNREFSVWTAYPTAQMQKDRTYYINSAAWWQMTEADPARDGDPQLITRENAEATVQYTHSGWEYPAGSFGVYKYTDSHPSHTHTTPARDVPDGSSNDYHNKNHTYDAAIGALRNNQSVTLEYEVLSLGYGYAYTAGPTAEVPDLPEGWERDPVHYLNWNYMMETTDEELSFQNITAGLTRDDYRFTEITVAAPEMFTYGPQSSTNYQLPGSEYGYRPDSSLARPAVEVRIKHADGTWELLETVQLRSGQTRKVRFPDDVIGYQTRIVTNQAACKLAVWPKVTLLPTENVKSIVETILGSYTYAVLDNSVHMKTLYYYGAEREDEVLPSQAAWLQAAEEESHVLHAYDSSSATLLAAGFRVSGTARVYEEDITNESGNRRIKATLQAYVDEESNQTTEAKYNEAVAAGAVIPETSGTWYVLLPKKFTVNTSTIRLRGYGYNDHVTDVKVTENFRNIGRTMVEVHATMTPKPERYSGLSGYTDRIRIYMDVYLSWHDYLSMAASNRRHHDYYVAFESGNPGRLGNLYDPDSSRQTVGYPDEWPRQAYGSIYIYDESLRTAMSGLDPAVNREERFVYAKGNIDVGTPDVSEQVEFRKDVRFDGEGIWGNGAAGDSQVTVPEGGEYTYRLTVSSRHDSKTAGIILYDAIEEHIPEDETGLNDRKNWSGDWNGKGQWQGTLTSVDISELTAMNCAPKLYYSTRAGLTFGRQNSVNADDTDAFDTSFELWDSGYKLSDRTIWQQAEESQISGGVWRVPDGVQVRAIAVDAQKSIWDAAYFPLNAGQSFSVYLHMKAPDDAGDAERWNAKGAYAHKTDNALSTDDIDWVKASDPANNMYAYNAATVVFIPFNAPSGSSAGMVQPRTFLNYRYNRVGIVPQTISVRKIWDDGVYVNSELGTVENYDGVRPDSVTVRLKGVTGSDDSPVISEALVLTKDNGWQGVFLNAPERDSAGNTYTYTVTEDPVEHYTTVIRKGSGTNKRSYEIINRHEKETVTITGKKLWLNPDGTPAEPTADQVSMGLKRVNAQGVLESVPSYKFTYPSKNNDWTYSFWGFDRYAMGGYEYKFVVTESAPSGWFSQNDTPPAGVIVTAEYDPDDITVFRNFKKPDIGYAMIHTYVRESSMPSEGNDAELPSFTFAVELKDRNGDDLDGEYDYILYDKGPYYSSDTALPADAARIGTGTIRNGRTITLENEQCAVVIGLPDRSRIRVTEEKADGWTAGGKNNSPQTIWTGGTAKITIPNEYKATAAVVVDGKKELAGREQRAREFAFEVTDGNEYDRWGNSNSDYNQVIATVNTGESRGTVKGSDGTVTGLAMFAFSPDFTYSELNEITEYGGSRTLYYTVREQIPSGAQTINGAAVYNDVTYDGRTVRVTVTITDNRDGTASTAVTTNPGGPLTFRNTYSFKKSITLTAHKELTGRTLQPQEFSFEVRRSGAAADSDPIATGTNDGEGSVVFTPEITLTEKDLAAASPETGIAEVTFLISEVKGTDPTVAYMTAPAEAKVQMAQKSDGRIVTALPGQEIQYEEIDCPGCGGTGKSSGLTVVLIDALSGSYDYLGSFSADEVFNDRYMDICPVCHGTGFDPDNPGTECGTCRGKGIEFRECTHENRTGGTCPDCLIGYDTKKAVHFSNGEVLLPYGSFPISTVEEELDMTAFPPPASANAVIAYAFK